MLVLGIRLVRACLIAMRSCNQ